MKKRITTFLCMSIALIFMGNLLTNCGGCNRGDRLESLDRAHFGFELIDAKTGKNLFTNPAYSIDSVRFVNSTNPLGKSKQGTQGEYTFGIDSTYNPAQNQLGQRVERTYYLYLNRLDTDTIRLSFLPIDGKCDPYFTDYQVYYNQRLITTSQNEISFFTKLNKP